MGGAGGAPLLLSDPKSEISMLFRPPSYKFGQCFNSIVKKTNAVERFDPLVLLLYLCKSLILNPLPL